MVYFLATRLLRDSGSGVSLLISPLLSLMRNQIEAATRIGLRAETINSTNRDDWDRVAEELRNDQIDILLISPERLANEDFRNNVLSHIAARVGLLAVDEAHCISDWGHDFRPDYRRIVGVLNALPDNIPVLATTATANDRVVNDIISQLGEDIGLIRGPLLRESLQLQNIVMSSPAARLAWLAAVLPSLPGSGIVYTLTQRDAERAAKWLNENGIPVRPYHAGLVNTEQMQSRRETLEQMLLNNEIKALVATVALGMGFDKPDIGFVIHFQRPPSVVHYYQQVGRAGRTIAGAYGILLHGEEDDRIADYFIQSAFPPQRHVRAIIQELEKTEVGLSLRELEARLNLKHSQLEKALKYLAVETPSPVTKIGSKWHLTAASRGYRVNRDLVQAISDIRRQEQAQMQEYMGYSGCLMEFLARALDDPAAGRCGKCANCRGRPVVPVEYDPGLANRAAIFLKRAYQSLPPRRQWPGGDPLPDYGFSGRIGEDLRAEEGRALCLWRDAGWGELVADGKYRAGRFDDELVRACAEMIKAWDPQPAPEWVVSAPSLNRPELVPDFARRLAAALGLPYFDCLRKIKRNSPQKEMLNSFQQARNLNGVFSVEPSAPPPRPCLLIDDIADSKWTLTVAAALLRRAGAAAVFPLVLALNSPRMD